MGVFLIVAGIFGLLTAFELRLAVRSAWRAQAVLAVESAGMAALFGAIALICFVMGR